jgi:pimeloyl-ACP methyl ester carboxylesterase
VNGGSLVCVHGVGGWPGDFVDWHLAIPQWSVVTPDLQAETDDLAGTTMDDYTAAVERVLPGSPPVVICGWSMGGLVAMMVAGRVPIAGLVLIEPSLPAEVQGVRDGEVPVRGTFDPDAIYGPRTDGIPARSDSQYAFGERRRGVFVGQVGCPTLVIGGRDFGATRSEPIASHLDADLEQFSSVGHVELLHDAEVLGRVSGWLDRVRLKPTE